MRKSTFLKLLPFFTISLILLSSLVSVSADSTSDLDLEMILSGIRHHDSSAQSGEGDVIYRTFQRACATNPGFDYTYKYYFMFSQRKMRMDIPEQFNEYEVVENGKTFTKRNRQRKVTFIDTGGEGMWTIQHPVDGRRYPYAYSTNPHGNRYSIFFDPRRILAGSLIGDDLSEYLRKGGFRVDGQEHIGELTCYVLVNDAGKRIWISPEQGFRCLKTEHKSVSQYATNSGIKKGDLMLFHKQISYLQYGEAWFPKRGVSDLYVFDERGIRHLVSREQRGLTGFRLNHDIPEENFTVKIPDGAKVRMMELGKTISKERFLKLYGPKH